MRAAGGAGNGGNADRDGLAGLRWAGAFRSFHAARITERTGRSALTNFVTRAVSAMVMTIITTRDLNPSGTWTTARATTKTVTMNAAPSPSAAYRIRTGRVNPVGPR